MNRTLALLANLTLLLAASSFVIKGFPWTDAQSPPTLEQPVSLDDHDRLR